jgi:hypothetical protein
VFINVVFETDKRSASEECFYVARICLRAKVAEQVDDSTSVTFLRLIHGVQNEVERFGRGMLRKRAQNFFQQVIRPFGEVAVLNVPEFQLKMKKC